MAINGLSTRPLYLQVRDVLSERIANGVWKPGKPIPNELDLAAEYGVSTGTMRKALDVMESERLISRQQGRGTFVNDQTSEELAMRFSAIRDAEGKRIAGEVELGEVTEGTANELECARLRLQPRDQVYRIRCVRLHQNQPFMVEEASMPGQLFSAVSREQRVSPSHRGACTEAWHSRRQGRGTYLGSRSQSCSRRSPVRPAIVADLGARSCLDDARRPAH